MNSAMAEASDFFAIPIILSSFWTDLWHRKYKKIYLT